MLTVNKFLFWFKLETGGRIIGWFILIGNILLAVTSWSGILFLSINNCSDLEKLGGKGFFITKSDICPYIRRVMVGGFAFVTIGCSIYAFLGWKCIKGMKTRDPTRIAPLMILHAIGTIYSIIPIFTGTFVGILVGLINCPINAYAFVVLHSLFKVFNTENP